MEDTDTLLEAMPPEVLAQLVTKVEQGRAADRLAPALATQPRALAAAPTGPPRKSHRRKQSAFRPLRKQQPEDLEQDERRQDLGDWGSGCHRIRPLYEVNEP